MACAVPAGTVIDQVVNFLLWFPRYVNVTWTATRRWGELEDRLRILEDRIKESREAAHIAYLPSEDDRLSLDTRFDKLENRADRLLQGNKTRRRRIQGIRPARFGFYCAETNAMEEIIAIEKDLKNTGEVTETYESDEFRTNYTQ